MFVDTEMRAGGERFERPKRLPALFRWHDILGMSLLAVFELGLAIFFSRDAAWFPLALVMLVLASITMFAILHCLHECIETERQEPDTS